MHALTERHADTGCFLIFVPSRMDEEVSLEPFWTAGASLCTRMMCKLSSPLAGVRLGAPGNSGTSSRFVIKVVKAAHERPGAGVRNTPNHRPQSHTCFHIDVKRPVRSKPGVSDCHGIRPGPLHEGPNSSSTTRSNMSPWCIQTHSSRSAKVFGECERSRSHRACGGADDVEARL